MKNLSLEKTKLPLFFRKKHLPVKGINRYKDRFSRRRRYSPNRFVYKQVYRKPSFFGKNIYVGKRKFKKITHTFFKNPLDLTGVSKLPNSSLLAGSAKPINPTITMVGLGQSPYPQSEALRALPNQPTIKSKRRVQRKMVKFTLQNFKTWKEREKIGFIYLTCTKNNTICTLTDYKGNTKAWNSAGTLGFKNTRKSTMYAGQGAAEMIYNTAVKIGYKKACISVKGLGRGKESSLRVLKNSSLQIYRISEETPIPHNGCRPPKKRRT